MDPICSICHRVLDSLVSQVPVGTVRVFLSSFSSICFLYLSFRQPTSLLSAFLPPSFLFLPSSFLPSFVLSFLSCLKCHFSLAMPILAELLQAAKKICSTSMFVSSKVFKICFTSGFLHLRWGWFVSLSCMNLLFWGMFTPILLYLELISWRPIDFCQRLFLNVLRWVFLSSSFIWFNVLIDLHLLNQIPF